MIMKRREFADMKSDFFKKLHLATSLANQMVDMLATSFCQAKYGNALAPAVTTLQQTLSTLYRESGSRTGNFASLSQLQLDGISVSCWKSLMRCLESTSELLSSC